MSENEEAQFIIDIGVSKYALLKEIDQQGRLEEYLDLLFTEHLP